MPAQEVLDQVIDKDLLNCSGALMVEHPIMSQYVEKIEGHVAKAAPRRSSVPSGSRLPLGYQAPEHPQNVCIFFAANSIYQG